MDNNILINKPRVTIEKLFRARRLNIWIIQIIVNKNLQCRLNLKVYYREFFFIVVLLKYLEISEIA